MVSNVHGIDIYTNISVDTHYCIDCIFMEKKKNNLEMATMGIIGSSNKASYIVLYKNLFRICTKLFCAIERVEKCSNSIYFYFLLSWSYKPFSFLRVVGWWPAASGYNKLYQSSVAYLRRHYKHYRSLVEQHFTFPHIFLIDFTYSRNSKDLLVLSNLKSVQSIAFMISFSIS